MPFMNPRVAIAALATLMALTPVITAAPTRLRGLGDSIFIPPWANPEREKMNAEIAAAIADYNKNHPKETTNNNNNNDDDDDDNAPGDLGVSCGDASGNDCVDNSFLSRSAAEGVVTRQAAVPPKLVNIPPMDTEPAAEGVVTRQDDSPFLPPRIICIPEHTDCTGWTSK